MPSLTGWHWTIWGQMTESVHGGSLCHWELSYKLQPKVLQTCTEVCSLPSRGASNRKPHASPEPERQMRKCFVGASRKIARFLGQTEADEKRPCDSFSQDHGVLGKGHRAFCQDLGDCGQNLTTWALWRDARWPRRHFGSVHLQFINEHAGLVA